MRKTLCSALLAAGLAATMGAAQATTFDSPTQAGEASTMTHGVPNEVTTNSPYPDGYNPTAVMGAGPITYTYTYPSVTTYSYPSVIYVSPAPLAYDSWTGYPGSSATETSNTPQRAGEASTMSGGVPNMSTNN